MARAFLASIPLAVVLVAALVVPLAVTPGTFGFHNWPTARGAEVTEHSVRETPRRVDVAAAPAAGRTRGDHRSFAAGPGPGPRGATKNGRAAGTATAGPDRRSAELTQTPPAGRDGRHDSASGPGDGDHHAPGGPGLAPATPSTPASEGEPTQPEEPVEDPQQIAAGETPVLRDNTPATPPLPVSPIQPVAPAPLVASPPDPTQDSGSGDLVGGLVHDIGRQLGFGHDGGY